MSKIDSIDKPKLLSKTKKLMCLSLYSGRNKYFMDLNEVPSH